jgi:FKBP-type peptidyl-prolyl cis-trans isomerase
MVKFRPKSAKSLVPRLASQAGHVTILIMKNATDTATRVSVLGRRFAATMAAAALAVTVVLAQQSTPTAPASGSGSAQSPAAKSSTTPAGKSAQGATAAKPRTGTTTRSAAPLTLKTDKEKASYAIGLSIGKSMKKDSVDVDTAILARGVKDAIAGGKTLLTDDEAKQEAMLGALGETNKHEGDAFLAANKTQEGVTTLPDGLQYKVLRAGDGPKPTANDSVVCNYRGTLLNNKEFDSSYKRGQPATFPVSGVIKGWTEALQLMPVGSKWQLFVPPDLAYGQRGAGADIGPNSTLIFEVELISIQAKDAK